MNEQGININQQVLVEVLQEKLALLTVREAQLEAVVQQLMAQQNELMLELTELKEANNASTDD